jgi:hypothetical protein
VIDRGTPAGLPVWEAAGGPMIPTLELADGRLFTFMHAAQIADELGLEPPPPSGLELLDDIRAIAESWLACARVTPWEVLVPPTRSRGRSLLELTVNVFRPLELLPQAWGTERYDWAPLQDRPVWEPMRSRDELVGYCVERLEGWDRFAAEPPPIEADDKQCWTPRGLIPFSRLLDFQRWNSAYHHRQLLDLLRTAGIDPPSDALDVDELPGLKLPAELY